MLGVSVKAATTTSLRNKLGKTRPDGDSGVGPDNNVTKMLKALLIFTFVCLCLRHVYAFAYIMFFLLINLYGFFASSQLGVQKCNFFFS